MVRFVRQINSFCKEIISLILRLKTLYKIDIILIAQVFRHKSICLSGLFGCEIDNK